MSRDWSLRLARPEDAGAFHRVEEDAAEVLRAAPELAGLAIPASRSEQDYLRLIRRGHCLSAVAQDEVIGFAAAAPAGRELHLHELSVARSWQRRRIGATLLEALAIDARNSGFTAITLTTWRDIAWNAPFYAAHGFVEIANGDAAIESEATETTTPQRCAMVRLLD
jgi:ribosomal protein S18 acetylase RimI-like enzyme